MCVCLGLPQGLLPVLLPPPEPECWEERQGPQETSPCQSQPSQGCLRHHVDATLCDKGDVRRDAGASGV